MEWAVEQKSQLATAMLQVTFKKAYFSFKHLVSGSMCWIDWVMSTVPMSKYDVDNEETPEDTLGLRQSGNDLFVSTSLWKVVERTIHSFSESKSSQSRAACKAVRSFE